MYFKHSCPVCNLQLTSDGRIKEYVRKDGESYYDIEIRDSCNADDLRSNVLRCAESLIQDGMSVKELCKHIMLYFNTGPDLACDLTKDILYIMRDRVYLPDKRRIKIIA
jgi:hypothetical protein